MVTEHAKCLICGGEGDLDRILSDPYVRCDGGRCVTGPTRATDDEAWAAWDLLMGCTTTTRNDQEQHHDRGAFEIRDRLRENMRRVDEAERELAAATAERRQLFAELRFFCSSEE